MQCLTNVNITILDLYVSHYFYSFFCPEYFFEENSSYSIGLQWQLTPHLFISKTLSPAERNYKIYDRELLAIIRALEKWRHYIQGSPHTTIILSDHKNLTYYWEAQKLTWQQAYWSLYLLEFDVKLIHTPGNKMVQSDALFRRPDLCPEEDNDNEDIMLPDNMFLNLIDDNLQEKIALSNDLDGTALEILLNKTHRAPT